MFHISKLKALGMPETGKMKTAVPRISVKLSCRSQSVSETSTGLRGYFAMNENFLGFQLAREEHNASIFYHESAERRHVAHHSAAKLQNSVGMSKRKVEKFVATHFV